MSRLFEELDYRQTPIGALSLRRRRELSLGVDVFEIKLGDEFLTSSLFTASEIALARLGLAALVRPELNAALDVVVGGLGSGYTAQAGAGAQDGGFAHRRRASQPVIDWHVAGLVPLGRDSPPSRAAVLCSATSSPWRLRQRLRRGLARARVRRRAGGHRPFARRAARCGQRRLLRRSGPRPAGAHLKARRRVRSVVERACRLRLHRAAGKRVFAETRAEPVTFHNPLQNKPFTQTVDLVRKRA